MNDDRLVSLDRMRYIKNTTSSRLALLAIVFNVLFFVSIYQSNYTYYYTITMGASIIYNLVFLLMAFLSSEGVKNYKRGYSWLLIALGVGQIIRMLILPVGAHNTAYNVGGQAFVMEKRQYVYTIVCLLLSGACCVASAIVNIVKSRELELAGVIEEASKNEA